MPICEGCGASFNDNFKFCPNCGRAKPEKTNVQIQVQAKRPTSALDCPNCRLADKVQKASAILSEQTHQVSGSQYVSDTYTDSEGKVRTRTYSVPINATQKSALANLLTPPKQPYKPGNYIILIWFAIAFFTFIGYGIIVAGLNYTLMGYLIFAVFVVGVIIFSIRSSRKYIRYYRLSLNTWEKVDNSRWKNAMSRWDRLYYCSRDDMVFILGENKTVPVHDMAKLLNQ